MSPSSTRLLCSAAVVVRHFLTLVPADMNWNLIENECLLDVAWISFEQCQIFTASFSHPAPIKTFRRANSVCAFKWNREDFTDAISPLSLVALGPRTTTTSVVRINVPRSAASVAHIPYLVCRPHQIMVEHYANKQLKKRTGDVSCCANVKLSQMKPG